LRLTMKTKMIFFSMILTVLLSSAGQLTAQALRGPLVVSSNWPECTNLTTWTRDVLRLDGVENASETRQGISVYTWLRLFNRVSVGGMQHYWEGPPGDEKYGLDAHKHLFVYGWGYCDTHCRIFESLWHEWTGDSTSAYRVCYKLGGRKNAFHTVYRVRLDGNYGAFDPRFGIYLLDHDSPDGRVLDWPEVGDDANILRNERYVNRCQPFFEYPVTERPYTMALEKTYFDSEKQWEAAGGKDNQPYTSLRHEMGDVLHDMGWKLPRGMKIERFWNNRGRKFYNALKTLNRPLDKVHSSGRFFRVTDKMFDSNYEKNDPNYVRMEAYLETVPRDEGYPKEMVGGRTIGQAWGILEYTAPLGGSGYSDAVSSNTGMLHCQSVPYLRPVSRRSPTEVVFDFYCPFVLIDGVFRGELCAPHPQDRVSVEFRALYPKPNNRDDAEEWTDWIEIAKGAGSFEKTLGRDEYKPECPATVHGKYRFQIRVRAYAAENPASVGLSDMSLKCHFENGIMSIPRLARGTNEITFKVADQAALNSPVKVTYRYNTSDGEKTHCQTLEQTDFINNQATYLIEAKDLLRSNSLMIEY
jgi:hypothetical protein